MENPIFFIPHNPFRPFFDTRTRLGGGEEKMEGADFHFVTPEKMEIGGPDGEAIPVRHFNEFYADKKNKA